MYNLLPKSINVTREERDCIYWTGHPALAMALARQGKAVHDSEVEELFCKIYKNKNKKKAQIIPKIAAHPVRGCAAVGYLVT